ncbi:hypothetical protein ACHIPZ_18605 [Antrihabitans sp. NCIMB 15449]|uniref:DUF4267 domain-containing protein n=1 Tax=Antrihabitans spumae TaxID=3373370 RepID=A0ABW7JT41_9NOCA
MSKPDRPAVLWTRVLLAALAVPQLFTGLWAVVATESWYRSFPGFGPMLVAAEPPYNAHLASDAGSGFVATGVFLLAAAWWGDRRVVLIAGVSLLSFALPHVIYHSTHPSPGLSDAENVVNSLVLTIAALLPLAVIVATAREGKSTTTKENTRR